MASFMVRLAVILPIFSSLILLSLARIPIDLATEPETQNQILLPEESNTTDLTLQPNGSTELEIIDTIKKVEEENKDAQLNNPALPDESPESQVVVESDPGMKSSKVIGWDPREDEEKKDEEIVRKKNSKRMDESDSDSDSDSDDEEEEQNERKKRKHKRGKKGGFLRRFLKWINFFD
jgi:biopolymer transport protein ExbD